mgnify:FL=1
MSLRDDWESINTILTNSGDAVRGDLDNKGELVEYTESLATIPKYVAGAGGAVGLVMGEEAGIYSKEDTNEASGLDGWEDPSDFGSIRPIATAGFSGAIMGGMALYGTKKFADYVRDQNDEYR